jgi:arylsulfatase A-like enzyme
MLVILIIAATGTAVARDEKPNIVLCMTDDQGWGDVSYNGLKHVETPNLDAMAAAGMQFNRFYAQPSCTPSRACFMTGRHPNRMAAFWPGMPFRTQEITIAQSLKLAGYTSAHFGKWHLNGVPGPGKPIKPDDPRGPLALGFDEYFSVSNWHDKDWTYSRHDGELVHVPGDSADAIVGEALKFIKRQAAAKQPFMALVWYGSPHSPFKATDADREAAGGSDYYGEMLGIDRSMGALRAGLRELGIADNILLLFCSDNGGWPNYEEPVKGSSNGPFRGRKGDMWEGGVRVPGIIEWPNRIKKHRVTEVPVCISDIYPTLVDLLDIKDPRKTGPIDGISILPLLDGKMKKRPGPMGFWQYDDRSAAFDGQKAWNGNRYKLVMLGADQFELYDLKLDPSETKDVSSGHPKVFKRFKAELAAWHESVKRSNAGKDYVKEVKE